MLYYFVMEMQCIANQNVPSISWSLSPEESEIWPDSSYLCIWRQLPNHASEKFNDFSC